jgi:hypothetical protein
MNMYVAACSALLFVILVTQLNRSSSKWLVFAVAATIVWGLTILFLQLFAWILYALHIQVDTVAVQLVV